MLPWGLVRLSGGPHKNYPQASLLEACERSEGQVGLLCLLFQALTTGSQPTPLLPSRMEAGLAKPPGALEPLLREKPAGALPVVLPLKEQSPGSPMSSQRPSFCLSKAGILLSVQSC